MEKIFDFSEGGCPPMGAEELEALTFGGGSSLITKIEQDDE